VLGRGGEEDGSKGNYPIENALCPCRRTQRSGVDLCVLDVSCWLRTVRSQDAAVRLRQQGPLLERDLHRIIWLQETVLRIGARIRHRHVVQGNRLLCDRNSQVAVIGVVEVLKLFRLALNLNGKLVGGLGVFENLAENVQTLVIAAGAGNDERNILLVVERRGEALIVVNMPC
jgi:hypothetical protein